MKPYVLRFTKEAQKDIAKLTPKLQEKLKAILLNGIAVDPRGGKKLVGDLQGLYSIRFTYQDRIVYSVDHKARIVTVHRTRTHYGD